MKKNSPINYLPAGYSDEDSEDDFFGYEHSKFQPLPVEKSPLDLKKEILLESVKTNAVAAIRNELDHGTFKAFDIDEPLDGRWNLLYHACSLGKPDIVKFLINERGVCVNMTELSETPLMVACQSEADSDDVYEVVKALVSESTIISSSNQNGITPLMFASFRGHRKVVNFLLSLNDAFDAIDNDGNNALFHAIEGKHLEVAKSLIAAGIDLTVINKSGFTAKDYAKDLDQLEIFELFPPDVEVYAPPGDYMSYNRFEDLFPDDSSDVPAYFPDVAAMLRGMNCEKFIDKFSQARVSFQEFLTISDDRLKEIGIEFPFQRKTIQMGLYNFFKEPWSTQSLYIPKDFKEDLNQLDLIYMMGNVLRQLVIIEANLVFIQKFKLPSTREEETQKLLVELKNHIKILEKKVSITQMSRPLLIKKKPKRNFLSNSVKFTVLGALPLIAIFSFKQLKK